MKITSKFFIKGEQHHEFVPENWHKLTLIGKFAHGNIQATLTDGETIGATEITLNGEGARRVINHVNGGVDLSTGGAFEGIPYDLILEEGEISHKLEYYIDLTKPQLFSHGNKGVQVKCQIVKRKSVDWFYEKADGFSFAYLFDIGSITDDLFEAIDYLIEKEFDPIKTFLTILTIVFITESITQMIDEITDRIAEVTGIFTAIKAAIKIFLTLAKHSLTIIAIIALLRDFFNNIMLGVRKHNGMKVLDLMKIGSEHLGLEFKSSILEGEYRNAIILPSKSDKGFFKSDSENVGYPGRQSSVYKYGDMIRTMLIMFNASIRIKDNVLRLERRDFWRSMTNYTLPNVDLPAYSLNTGEQKSNYLLRFLKDGSDLNTLENVDGLNYQSTAEPNITIEKDLNLLKGLDEKTIQLAQGHRKKELNNYEKVFNIITLPFVAVANVALKGVNELRKAFNKLNNFLKKLKKVLKIVGVKVSPNKGNDPGDPPVLKIETIKNSRKNVLKLSDHTFAIDKIILAKDGKILPANDTILSAEYLFYEFHKINTFLPENGNQGKIYKNVETSFCLKEFVTLLDFNGFSTVDGKSGDMIEIRWVFHELKASLDFIIYDPYTYNFRDVEPPKKIIQEAEEVDQNNRFHDRFHDENYD